MRHDWGVALAAIALAAATAPASGSPQFQVIAHPGVPGTRISRANLAALFTGKASEWGNKAEARPVDQSAHSPVRRAFTTAVLGLSIGEVQMYWQRRVSADHVFPPPVRDSDQDVIAYVATTAGAIGYVGPDTRIPEGVKVVALVD